MKNKRYLIAVMFAVVSLAFVSCQDEEDFEERGSFYKTKTIKNLSDFEDNKYSAEEIFNLTLEFSNQLKEGNVKPMEIKQAVVAMETFWNYGIVAKQERIKGESYPAENFQFTVPLTRDKNIISGEDLEKGFKRFVKEVQAKMQGRVLNNGDMSVIAYDGSSVTFNLQVFGFGGGDHHFDPDPSFPPTVDVLKPFGSTINVPSTVTFDPNLLPEPHSYDLSFYDILNADAGDPVAISLSSYMQYCQESIPGYAVNIRVQDVTLSILDAFHSEHDMFCIYPTKPVPWHTSGHWFDYYIKDNQFIADTLLQSVLYTIHSSVSIPSGYRIIECDLYAYRRIGMPPTNNAYYVPPAYQYAKFCSFSVTYCQVVREPILYSMANQINVSWQ